MAGAGAGVAGAGVAGAGAAGLVPDGAAGVVVMGIGRAGAACCAGATGAATPPTTEPAPCRPISVSPKAPSRNNVPRIRRRPREHGGTGARAECRLAARAAERGGHVSALALLKEDHYEQQDGNQDVQGDEGVIQHNASGYYGLPRGGYGSGLGLGA